MVTVVVGISGHNNPVVAEIIDIVLNPQGYHKIVQLFILVDLRFLLSIAVPGFAAKGVNCLGIDIAAGHHRSGRRLPLGEEYVFL